MKNAKKKTSRKCLDAQHLALDLSCGAKRHKLRARGRPFPKNHSYGLAHRFKPGISPNPGGRPSTRKYSEALRTLLGLKTTEPIPVGTNAEKLAEQVFRLATKGKKKLGAIAEIGDRTEGRPAVSVTVDDKDPMTQLVIQMADLSQNFYGPPEGMPKREASSDEEGAEIDSP